MDQLPQKGRKEVQKYEYQVYKRELRVKGLVAPLKCLEYVSTEDGWCANCDQVGNKEDAVERPARWAYKADYVEWFERVAFGSHAAAEKTLEEMRSNDYYKEYQWIRIHLVCSRLRMTLHSKTCFGFEI